MISALSIRRPILAWMMMFALIFFGALCFKRLGVSQMPDVDFPMVNISLNLEGAAPHVMELDVVDFVEQAVMGIQGIRSVVSSSKQGSANVTVEFDLNRDINVAVQEIQVVLQQVQKKLPKDMDPPAVTKNNPEDNPIMWLTLSSDGTMPLPDVMAYARDVLKGQFSIVPGVSDIFLGGYVDPNLRVWISNDKLNQYQLTVTDVVSAIQSEHGEIPAGRIETPTKEYNLRVLGEAASPEEFGKIRINQRGGQPNYTPLFLHQLGLVEEGLADVRRISRFKGRSAIGLGIRKQHGENAVRVGSLVKEKLEHVGKMLPHGLSLDLNFDSTKFIKDSINELIFTLILSAVLTALVCFLFLGSWSSTVNVLMAIPTSIIGAFIGFYIFGFTLNTFTLISLSLAIGIVVDDAIMVLENIVRHFELGKSRREAALDGAAEITFAAIAATIAIAAIFLPVAFMQGVIGKFFFQFGVAMTIAVFLSLLEALTLTPMRCSQFLKVSQEGWVSHIMDKIMGMTARNYSRVLSKILHHRWKFVTASVGLFILSLLVVKPLRKEFVPAQDQSMFLMRLQAPVGSSLAFTDEKFKIAENYLAGVSEVLRYYTAVGGFGGGDVNTGMIFITLKDLKERDRSQQQVMDLVRGELTKKLPDIKIGVQDLSMRGFAASRGFPVEFTIQGPDWDKLAQFSETIMKRLSATNLVTDVDTDYRIGQPEVQIYPDREKAAARGVSVSVIGQTVGTLMGGVVAGKYSKGGHRYDVRVRLAEQDRLRIEDLKKIYVRNNRGELIALEQLVKIEEKPTLQLISRRNQERAVSIFANLKTGASQQQALQEAEQICKEVLPDGYHMVLTGNAESMKESFQSLMFAIIIGILVSYMILASQFDSLTNPIAVLMALPFSITGGLLALYISGQSINMYSFIGFILLTGIVKKNSILIVDFTNQKRREGLNVRDALLQAAVVRLRPIIMTSVATIVGALPAALSWGPGAETRAPMAVTVVGGVLVSTFISLMVVPCVYSLTQAHQDLPVRPAEA